MTSSGVLRHKWDYLWSFKVEFLLSIVGMFTPLTGCFGLLGVCISTKGHRKLCLCSAANSHNHCDHTKYYFIGFLISIRKYERLEWELDKEFSEKTYSKRKESYGTATKQPTDIITQRKKCSVWKTWNELIFLGELSS